MRHPSFPFVCLAFFLLFGLLYEGCPSPPPLPPAPDATESASATERQSEAMPIEPLAEPPQVVEALDAGPNEAPDQEAVPEPIVEQAPPEPEPIPTAYAPIVGGTVLQDSNPDPAIVEVQLEAKPLTFQLTPKHNVTLYAYNGLFPGPIIHAKVGDTLIVHFTNSLPEPTTIHWHGQRVPNDMDGAPLVQTPVAAGGKFTYQFTLRDSGTYWYHPHVKSHEQVEKGLYGMLIVEEAQPIGFTRQRAFFLDDILLTDTGLAPFEAGEQEKLRGRLGSHYLVNGKPLVPVFQAKAGDRERWRLANPANARVMNFQLVGARARIIGSDSGLFVTPMPWKSELQMAPGQRYDIEVLYDQPGKVEFQVMVIIDNRFAPTAMFQVDVTGEAPATPPRSPRYPIVEPYPQRPTVRRETVTFELLPSPDPGGNHWAINGKAHPKEPLYVFKQGDVVEFTLHNLANPNHPFHLHGQFFEVLSRNDFPVTNEPGLRDTTLVSIQERVVIKAYLDNPGKWMFHCHNLEHAAYGMMAHIVVTPKE